MKKLLTNILISLCVIAVVGGVFVPVEAKAVDVAGYAAALVGSFINISLDTVVTVLGYLGGIVLEISARLLAISGILLNSAMNVTLNLSGLVNSNDSIGAVWRTIRDFSSIFFIFILLYASISTILGAEGAMSPKKLIPKIVICGLLINFSLFFTKIIIDGSNVVAMGFYSAIAPSNDTSKQTNFGGGFIASDGGISNVFMQTLGVLSIYNPQGAAEAKEDFGRKTVASIYFGAAIMVIAAASFLLISIMLMVRIVVLLILLATSPIYFIAMVLPKTQEYASKWMSTLIGQSLFPVVYLALVYISLKIIKSFNDLNNLNQTNNESFAELFINGNNVSVLFNYILVIILLNSAVVVAAKFMGETSKWSGNIHKRLTGVVGSYVGRRTLGWAAYKAKESDTFKSFASRAPVFGLATSKSLGALANKKFGGDKVSYESKLKDDIKKKKGFYKTIGEGDNKEAGKARQEQYFKSLSSDSLLTFMLTNRTDKEAYKEIKKERDKKEAKKNKEKNKQKTSQLDKEISEIDELLKNDLVRIARKDELEEKKARLEKERDDVKKKVDMAEEAEEEERLEKLSKKVKGDGDKDKDEDKEKKDEGKKENKDK